MHEATLMTSMIEKIAQAMWSNVGLADPDLDTMRDCAREALTTLLEPTEEMVEAALEVISLNHPDQTGIPRYVAESTIQAAIRRALQDV